MGRNTEKDAIEMAAKNRRILENGFHIFADRTIEKVTMAEVAKAANIGIASLYRYYSTKPDLVIAVATWVWTKYMDENADRINKNESRDRTAAEELGMYLDLFLDMYREHKDILRFNQLFNVYLQSEDITESQKAPYLNMIQRFRKRFSKTYAKGLLDGTLRADIPEGKMFASALHLMLAAVTRYAVGLAYNDDTEPEEEIRLEKAMLMQQFCTM